MWNESPVQVGCMIWGAQAWCAGMTQRDGMGREMDGGFRMGNTCTPMEDSSQCNAKPIQYCKVKWTNKLIYIYIYKMKGICYYDEGIVVINIKARLFFYSWCSITDVLCLWLSILIHIYIYIYIYTYFWHIVYIHYLYNLILHWCHEEKVDKLNITFTFPNFLYATVNATSPWLSNSLQTFCDCLFFFKCNLRWKPSI